MPPEELEDVKGEGSVGFPALQPCGCKGGWMDVHMQVFIFTNVYGYFVSKVSVNGLLTLMQLPQVLLGL